MLYQLSYSRIGRDRIQLGIRRPADYQLSYSRMEGLRPSPRSSQREVIIRLRAEWWGEQDSNLRRREPADLQSAPVGRLGISPVLQHGANGRIRTPDLLITNQLLYQLSYIGLYNTKKNGLAPFQDR